MCSSALALPASEVWLLKWSGTRTERVLVPRSSVMPLNERHGPLLLPDGSDLLQPSSLGPALLVKATKIQAKWVADEDVEDKLED